MSFKDELSNYMEILNCNSSELADKSMLSPTTIDRYLNGQRIPKPYTDSFSKIVDGLYELYKNKNISINKDEIIETLSKDFPYTNIDFNNFAIKFDELINTLDINIKDLSYKIGYDPSFISRIRTGSRKPSDVYGFINNVANFIMEHYYNDKQKQDIITLFNCSFDDIENEEDFRDLLFVYLISEENNNQDIEKFLNALDSFNLNDYIGKDFKKVKVPTSPIILRNSKAFYGPEGRKQAEGEFLKTTLLSKSDEPIFFYSNLPMVDAGKDEEFKSKWVLAISMILKKGLHLNMVHDIERPIEEMILGLENWIPIYMTGSISPYYFENPPSNVFKEMHCTSGSVALSAESFGNDMANSKFYYTTKKEEVEFYKQRSKYLLSKAKPLMRIYKKDNKNKFEKFLKNEEDKSVLENIQKDCFKNIDFTLKKQEWVIVNKKTSPEMHFVIYNPKLRDAIENFLLK